MIAFCPAGDATIKVQVADTDKIAEMPEIDIALQFQVGLLVYIPIRYGVFILTTLFRLMRNQNKSTPCL